MAHKAQTKSKRISGEELWASRKEEILTRGRAPVRQARLLRHRHPALAETIGVGKGTLYRYFPSKRELFLAAADRVMRDAARARRRAASRASTIRSTGSRSASAPSWPSSPSIPEFVELLIQERAQFKDRKRPTYFEHREANVERWRDHVSRADRRRAACATCRSSGSPTSSAICSTARCSPTTSAASRRAVDEQAAGHPRRRVPRHPAPTERARTARRRPANVEPARTESRCAGSVSARRFDSGAVACDSIAGS